MFAGEVQVFEHALHDVFAAVARFVECHHVLGVDRLVDPLLARGQLVAFGPQRIASGQGYYMIQRQPHAPETQGLRDWLIAESKTVPGPG